MKLGTFFTQEYEELFDNVFYPSAQAAGFEIVATVSQSVGRQQWGEIMAEKVASWIKLHDESNEPFCVSDVDVSFASNAQSAVLQSLGPNDVVLEYLPPPCAGFMLLSPGDRTRLFLQMLHDNLIAGVHGAVINETTALALTLGRAPIRWGYFARSIVGGPKRFTDTVPPNPRPPVLHAARLPLEQKLPYLL